MRDLTSSHERRPDASASLYSGEWEDVAAGTLQALWPKFILGERVVELGAASGRNQSLLANSSSYVGFERDSRLLAEAELQGRDVRKADLAAPSHEMLYEVSQAQTVLMLDVLEHLADPRQLLRLIASQSRPGSRWLISVPNFGFLTTRLSAARGRFPKRSGGHFDETHLHHFTRDTILHWLLSDMDDISLQVIGTALPVQGNRISQIPGGRRVVLPLTRRLAQFSSRASPKLLSFEWLCVVDQNST